MAGISRFVSVKKDEGFVPIEGSKDMAASKDRRGTSGLTAFCRLLLRTHLLTAAVIWLHSVSTCTGQKPIKVPDGKKHDLFIAGLFPLGKHVPESHIGRGVMPSVKLAIAHVSDNMRNRDYRLHMWWNDTECNAAVGVKAFFDMMHSGPHKLMLFGAACTQVTDPIAKASKHWRLTQLSYADTHPMFTSDSFPNFFRVVPSENAFNAPRIALLLSFNWTRVGTIYQNEPRYALAHNRLVAELDDNSIEIVETQSFATEVTSALEKLKEQDARIILGNFNEVWARRIFCEAYKFGMFGRKYQWIIMGMYNEEWWLRPGGGCAPVELMEALRDTILTDLLPLSSENRTTVAGITPREYQEEYDRIRQSEYSRFHGYAYDGIWTIALAIEHVQRRIRHFRRGQSIANFKYRDPLWEKLFLEALKNTSFEGVTGTVRFYDNERKANILLKQFQNGSEEEVGEFDGVTGVLNLNKGLPLVWRGKSPPKDRTRHHIKHSTVNITIYAVLTAASSVGIVLAFVFLAINIKYRNQRYIKMSSPHLNNLIIVGCMLSYSSVIFLGLDSQLSSVTAFPYICTARACLLMVGFSLAFGSMFSKTWRVHTIFTDVKLNKKVIKDYQLFMVVGVLLLIDMAIITTWQVADPFYRETKQMEPYPDPSSEDIMIIPENEYCQSNRMTVYLVGIYAYKGLLMIFGAFLAWETRHVSMPALNDSKYVGMSVYNVVISCLTGAAISFVLDDNQDVMFMMLAVLIIFCSTGTLCFVFVPKIIELRRNPDGAIDKRNRPTLRPPSKTRRSSSISELEERLKEATLANQKFRKQLSEKDGELQMFLRRLADDEITDTQEAMDRLTVPRQEGILRKEEPAVQPLGPVNRKGLSVTTETTDVSMSMCSLNSTTVSQPEGDYVNVCPTDQATKKKTSFSGLPSIAIDGERRGSTAKNGTTVPASKQQCETVGAEVGVGEDEKNTTGSTQPERASVEFVPEAVEETDSIVLEETEIPRDLVRNVLPKDDSRPRLPTPPPGPPTSAKNVSFGRLDEQNYLEQAILPPPIQFVPKHRHAAERRSSVKNNGVARSHRELFEVRRTSVPSNTISYISTESVSRVAETSFDEPYVIGECGHKRSITSGTGYRCEKHGGAPRGGHGHVMHNGSAADTPPLSRIHRKHHDSHNVSSPSVPAVVNASYSDTEKYEESMSTVIQRSVSERSREKCARGRIGSSSGATGGNGTVGAGSSGMHAIGECPHRAAARRIRECRHHRTESKLRSQQEQLEYVQSTPNVATIHNSKYASGNPRNGVPGVGVSGSTGTAVHAAKASGSRGTGTELVGGSAANVSKIYSAVSDGELLDLAILPIFQKLLTERHKSSVARGGAYGASGASCPNISIKCDIVEYL